MKLLLSSLQLASLCALSSWSASSQLVISQSEDVTVVEGDTAHITCCWTGEPERLRVSWINKKNKTITNDIFNRTYKSNENVSSKSCSNLTLANITQHQSGTYICRVQVEIPFYFSGDGNGTVVTVVSKNESNNKKANQHGENTIRPSHIILIGVAVVLTILLIVLVRICSLRRRQAQAARVIYEVPHFDSETPEGDKHSTGSSRGSSQWCQVPVYESCPYFEPGHGEAKESG